MAESVAPQAQFDQFVELVAQGMGVDVCSIYLRRRDSALELYATHGLAPEAVHQTVLAPGEGLVGLVVERKEPVNLDRAQEDTRFSYRPETGEEPFNAFLGVPILRGGRRLGVLVVQTRDPRRFFEDEVEALQTVAMVLAELVASRDLGPEGDLTEPDFDHGRPDHLVGTSLAEGLARGQIVLHAPPVRVDRVIAEDSEREAERLEKAIQTLRADIDRFVRQHREGLAGVPLDVFEAYRLFAHDRGWAARLREAVLNGLTAEAAVERVRIEDKARFAEHPTPYIRERSDDLDDLAERMLRILTGQHMTNIHETLPKDAILAARSLGPGELLHYPPGSLKGLLLEQGGTSSHVAIVARALELPAVGHLPDLLERVAPGEDVLVDGTNGHIHLRPPPSVTESFSAKQHHYAKRLAVLAQRRDLPAETPDGVRITMMANIGLELDLPLLHEAGIDGVGLFRTELQFLISSSLPRIAAQRRLYKRVLQAAESQPVVFRLADLGGDKLPQYLRSEPETNPALGWRGIRISLDRPGLLRFQLRALIEAAGGHELNLLAPMLCDVTELQRVRSIVDKEVERAKARGRTPPSNVRVGAMIETPAAAFSAREIAREADFLSLGTNDLHQFFFAADRNRPSVSGRYSEFTRSFLSLLQDLARVRDRNGGRPSVCGGMAAKPLSALVLIGLGFRSLSLPLGAADKVKEAVRAVPEYAARTAVESLLNGYSVAGFGENPFESLAHAYGLHLDDGGFSEDWLKEGEAHSKEAHIGRVAAHEN
jgi:phosphotransferase system enzyme I (PtsP)